MNQVHVMEPLAIRVGGDYADPYISIDDKVFLAANPMSDRQMAVWVPENVPRGFGINGYGSYSDTPAALRAEGGDCGPGSETIVVSDPGDPGTVFGTSGQSARHSDRITLSASDDNGSNAVCVTGERTHALTTEGADASEDGTGRGTPIVFDTAQITSNVNRTRVEPGLPSSTLASNSNMHVALPLQPIGYNRANGGSHDADAPEARPREILRVLRQAHGAQAFQEWGLGVLTALQSAQVLRPLMHGSGLRSAPGEDESSVADGASPLTESGGRRPMREMWQAECLGRASQEWGLAGQHVGELGAYLSELSQPGASQTKALHDLWEASEGLGVLRDALSTLQDVGRSFESRDSTQETLFGGELRSDGACQGNVRPPLHAGEEGGNPVEKGVMGWGVRRLTPLETERLQGLPDDWSRQGADGKELSDTARYLMIGNGGAVPVLEWIARRIALTLAAREECAS